MNDLSGRSTRELFELYVAALDELRAREVIRSTNNPVGDYCELLCARALGLTLADKSRKGYDATDAAGHRYQVKARRLTPHNRSRQLGSLRELETAPFDLLAGVLLNADFSVHRAALIPCAVVHAAAATRPNGARRFLLRDAIWSLNGVVDITAALRAIAD